MTTKRPRHQVTETEAVAHALDLAERRWPGEKRSRLLVRLVQLAGSRLEDDQDDDLRRRRAALEKSAGAYDEAYPDGYLDALRADWPA
jgi:hypothetical protein